MTAERVRQIAEAHRRERGPLLVVLQAVQAELGWIDPEAVPVIADVLNLSTAEVHGVATFYADFRAEPPPALSVRLCRAEACQANACEAVVERAEHRLGVRVGERDPLGRVALDEVFCLGLCGIGPSAMVDGHLHARLDPDALDSILNPLLNPLHPVDPLENLEPAPVSRAGARDPGAGSEGLGAAAGAVTVFVPGDAAAVALGADDVAAALAPHATVVRNGSRGMHWLEPLIEVVGADGVRLAYGPVRPADVEPLLAAGLLDPAARPALHPLALGPTEELPWLREQTRLTFARVGVVDPRSAGDYEAHGGRAGIELALAMAPADIVAEIVESGLRGRGGAGFPAGIKWRTVLEAGASGGEKHVVANADEGDSGTFADRMLMEGDPFLLLDGMAIAAHAVGAADGWIYVRSEYPHAIAALDAAIAAARAKGWLGPDALGPGRPFDVHLRVGAGAYICGEETAMLESLEGKRGVVRAKPPLPAIEGLFGRPTVVNNVLTLAAVPGILAGGAAAYAAHGVERSRGTQVVQLAGDVARPGAVEVPFGTSLRDLVERWGGGTRTGRPVRAVQAGGPLGAYLPASAFDLPLDYEAFAAAGAMVGHGGIVVFDERVDMAQQARFAMRFCAEESCGKCTPCRVGAVRGVEVLDRIIAGEDRAGNLALLEDLCEVMADGSLCAMGGLTPNPVRSATRHFPEDFAGD